MKRFAILTIHGMGEAPEETYQDLERRLREMLPASVLDDALIKTLYYHDQMQGFQDDVWENMDKEELDWRTVRKFFLNFFSDAATTEHKPQIKLSVYQKIHRKIRDTLKDVQQNLDDPKAPVIIIAHSLGCQVLSNYIWDAQKRLGIWKGKSPTVFQKFGTLRFLFTAGCNIPLFVSGFEKVLAIKKPHPEFLWYNYYDRDDILGWPLAPLSVSYKAVITEDIEINTGITPLSHSNYWRDRDFLLPVVKKIKKWHGEIF